MVNFKATARHVVAFGMFTAAAAGLAPALAQGWFDFSRSRQGEPAQAEIAELSVRIDQLEELVRRLTGEVEELRYRLDAGGSGGTYPSVGTGGAMPGGGLADTPGSIVAAPVPVSPAPPQQAPGPPGEAHSSGGPTSLLPPSPYLPDGAQTMGAPPRSLGTIPGAALGGTEGPLVAAAPQTQAPAAMSGQGGAEDAYNAAYAFLLAQDFAAAEYAFAKFLADYPGHDLSGNAQYWLGESFYARGQYRRAAQEFLHGYQNYPASRKAPDNLLKLGMTLAQLGQKDQACASLGEVTTRFPQAEQAVRDRAVAERHRVGC